MDGAPATGAEQTPQICPGAMLHNLPTHCALSPQAAPSGKVPGFALQGAGRLRPRMSSHEAPGKACAHASMSVGLALVPVAVSEPMTVVLNLDVQVATSPYSSEMKAGAQASTREQKALAVSAAAWSLVTVDSLLLPEHDGTR